MKTKTRLIIANVIVDAIIAICLFFIFNNLLQDYYIFGGLIGLSATAFCIALIIYLLMNVENANNQIAGEETISRNQNWIITVLLFNLIIYLVYPQVIYLSLVLSAFLFIIGWALGWGNYE